MRSEGSRDTSKASSRMHSSTRRPSLISSRPTRPTRFTCCPPGRPNSSCRRSSWCGALRCAARSSTRPARTYPGRSCGRPGGRRERAPIGRRPNRLERELPARRARSAGRPAAHGRIRRPLLGAAQTARAGPDKTVKLVVSPSHTVRARGARGRFVGQADRRGGGAHPIADPRLAGPGLAYRPGRLRRPRRALHTDKDGRFADADVASRAGLEYEATVTTRMRPRAGRPGSRPAAARPRRSPMSCCIASNPSRASFTTETGQPVRRRHGIPVG